MKGELVMEFKKLFALLVFLALFAIAGNQAIYAKKKNGRKFHNSADNYKVVVIKVKNNAFYMFTLHSKRIANVKLLKGKKALMKALASMPDDTEILEEQPTEGG